MWLSSFGIDDAAKKTTQGQQSIALCSVTPIVFSVEGRTITIVPMEQQAPSFCETVGWLSAIVAKLIGRTWLG